MGFEQLNNLYALVMLPVWVVLFITVIYRRGKSIKKLGDSRLVERQLVGYIPGRTTFKFILLALSLVVIIIGWANLRQGDQLRKIQRKGVDVVFALDVSKSMLANDIQPNRLTRAKQLIMSMAEKIPNDRVALVLFAGHAYPKLPLTTDFSALKMMVDQAGPDAVPTQGTVIGEAIDKAQESFSQTEHKYKSIIIISDGEDHDEEALKKVKEATENGVIIHTVGIGSPQGTTLYDPETRSVKLDEKGQPVISKLNEEELRSIAAAGRGTYSLLQNSNDVTDKLVSRLNSMEQRSFEAPEYEHYISYFQYFLLLGFILLFVEWLLPGAKSVTKQQLNETMA